MTLKKSEIERYREGHAGDVIAEELCDMALTALDKRTYEQGLGEPTPTMLYRAQYEYGLSHPKARKLYADWQNMSNDMPEDWLSALEYHMATKPEVFKQVDIDRAALLREVLVKLQAPVEIRQHPMYAKNLIVRIVAALK